MIYLLDTHTFLWAAMRPSRLSDKARALISDRAQPVQISVVSFWEMALKYALGKLALEGVRPEQMPEVAAKLGLSICPLEAADAAASHLLPKMRHKDPFDRMLVWQCIRQGMTLLSADNDLKSYRAAGLQIEW